MTGLSLVLGVLMAQSPGADSVRLVALREQPVELMAQARAHPTEIREAIADGMARAVRPPGPASVELDLMRRLAIAYAEQRVA